jgi:hypothetical protein
MKQSNFRLPERTIRQLNELAKQFNGNRTAALIAAVNEASKSMEENKMYSVTTLTYSPRIKRAFSRQYNKKMTLRSVATYSAAIVKNVAFEKDGEVRFAFGNDDEDDLTVYCGGIGIVRMFPSGNIIFLDADIYAFDTPACNYIKAALECARNEAKACMAL